MSPYLLGDKLVLKIHTNLSSKEVQTGREWQDSPPQRQGVCLGFWLGSKTRSLPGGPLSLNLRCQAAICVQGEIPLLLPQPPSFTKGAIELCHLLIEADCREDRADLIFFSFMCAQQTRTSSIIFRSFGAIILDCMIINTLGCSPSCNHCLLYY